MKAYDTIISRWTDPNSRPLFKGSLIDGDGCCCAQGDILRHECKMTDEALRDMEQFEADRIVADTLGISLLHSVLLRVVNDSQDGCPQDVLTDPEKVLGGKWRELLALGRWMDAMTDEKWPAAGYAAGYAASAAARAAASAAAGDAAGDAARSAAGEAAGEAAWYAAGSAAGEAAWYAALEVMGSDILKEQGNSLYFLPMLGIESIQQLMAWDADNVYREMD